MKIRGFIISGILLAIAGGICCTVAFAAKDFDWKALRIDVNLENHEEEKDLKNNLTLDVDCGRISVHQSDVEKFSFKYVTSDYATVKFEETTETLTLKQTLSWKQHVFRPIMNSIFDADEYTIEVIIPNAFSGDLTIENSVGEIVIDKLTVNNIKAKCDTGGLIINDVTANTIYGEVNVGNLTLQTSNANEVALYTDVGNQSIFSVRTHKFEAKVDVGNLEFTLLESDIITLKNDVGSISGTILGDKNEYSITFIEGGSTKEKITVPGDKSVYAKVDVGEIKIRWVN